jgi:predicted alpha/beta hydrolase
MCAWTLARGHARSGDQVAIAAYLGSGDAFDRAVAGFSQKYADQNALDYAALLDAIAAGRLEAQTGV